MLPVTISLGKKSFLNDQEGNCWWEASKVICYDYDNISASFTINFINYNDCHNETLNFFYGILKLPLSADYLNYYV